MTSLEGLKTEEDVPGVFVPLLMIILFVGDSVLPRMGFRIQQEDNIADPGAVLQNSIPLDIEWKLYVSVGRQVKRITLAIRGDKSDSQSGQQEESLEEHKCFPNMSLTRSSLVLIGVLGLDSV